MKTARLLLSMVLGVSVVAPLVAQERRGVQSSGATAFLGTWAIVMGEPLGAHETVKIWDNDGVLAASIQSEQSPRITVTGMLQEGNVLWLTTTRVEHGQPMWAVIVLTRDGDTMQTRQMLQPSRTIKTRFQKEAVSSPLFQKTLESAK
jgi:hypothetical protein